MTEKDAGPELDWAGLPVVAAAARLLRHTGRIRDRLPDSDPELKDPPSEWYKNENNALCHGTDVTRGVIHGGRSEPIARLVLVEALPKMTRKDVSFGRRQQIVRRRKANRFGAFG